VINFSEYLIKWGLTGIIWSAWCVLHSMLNSEGLIRGSGLLDSAIGRYYRLIYSIIAVITLLLASWMTPRWQGFELWRFRGPTLVIPVLVWAPAVVMFCLTFRFVNMWDSLGLSSLGIGRKSSESQEKLITWGIYGVIRHPQFAAGLMMLWARDLTDRGLVINIVLSLYLIIGARIEETRLLTLYGDPYAQYMKKIPRFIPNRIPSPRALFQAQSASADERQRKSS
jgi:protein-S-isoprenylcysteine O-methyltransferase Ste14